MLENVIQVARADTPEPGPNEFHLVGGIHFPNGIFEPSPRLLSNSTEREKKELDQFLSQLNDTRKSVEVLEHEIAARSLAGSFYSSEKWFVESRDPTRTLTALKTIAAMQSLESLIRSRSLCDLKIDN